MTTITTDWNIIETQYATLSQETITTNNASDWIYRWSNLEKNVMETYTTLKRISYENTQDQSAQNAYNTFVEHMFSTQKSWNSKLAAKLLNITNYTPSPNQEQFLRRLRNDANLYREENVPLLAHIARLTNTYRDLSWSINNQVQEQLASHPQTEHEQHRSQLYHQFWLEQRETINDLFMELLSLRRQVAHNAELPNYRAYRWREMHRLDYTPDDCLNFHAAVETEIVPLLTLRANIEYPQPTPLDAHTLKDGVTQILSQMDPEFSELFERMCTNGFVDLEPRPGRANVSEEWFFPQTGLPFLMLGTDLFTLLHEFGHGYHDYTSLKHQELAWNFGSTEEFQEFAAMTMMMLSYPHLEHGGEIIANEARLRQLRNLDQDCLRSFPGFILDDAFEHWIYGEAPKDVQPADLDAKWLELSKRFFPDKDQQMSRIEQMTGWQRDKWSLFRMPFYMVSYPIAVMGAYQVWRNSLMNYPEAVQKYKAALKYGFTKPLPELCSLAGIQLPFDRQAVRDTIQFVVDYLDQKSL